MMAVSVSSNREGCLGGRYLLLANFGVAAPEERTKTSLTTHHAKAHTERGQAESLLLGEAEFIGQVSSIARYAQLAHGHAFPVLEGLLDRGQGDMCGREREGEEASINRRNQELHLLLTVVCFFSSLCDLFFLFLAPREKFWLFDVRT
jgi:hypothetical protein